MLLIHIGLAVLSMLCGIYASLKSSPKILNLTYILSASVILSGISLALEMPMHLGRLCLSGFMYVSFMIISLKFASGRMNKIH